MLVCSKDCCGMNVVYLHAMLLYLAYICVFEYRKKKLDNLAGSTIMKVNA
jgi:hypothetical protein